MSNHTIFQITRHDAHRLRILYDTCIDDHDAGIREMADQQRRSNIFLVRLPEIFSEHICVDVFLGARSTWANSTWASVFIRVRPIRLWPIRLRPIRLRPKKNLIEICSTQAKISHPPSPPTLPSSVAPHPPVFRGGQTKVGPRRVGSQKFALFVPSPATVFFLSSLS